MNLYLRILAVLRQSLRAPPMALFDTSRLVFRTRPGDLDLNGHMNNGRYLTLMDLGRLDMTIRIGLHRPLVQHRWRPLVASEMVRFKKSLHLFEEFELLTRVLAWDQRAVYVEQRFMRREDTVAVGIVRAMFTCGKEHVPPERMVRAVGFDGPPPPLPPSVTAWQDAERELWRRGAQQAAG